MALFRQVIAHAVIVISAVHACHSRCSFTVLANLDCCNALTLNILQACQAQHVYSSVPVQAPEAVGPAAQHSAQQLSSSVGTTPAALTAPQPVPLVACLVTHQSLSESEAESPRGKEDQRQMLGPSCHQYTTCWGAGQQHQQVSRNACRAPVIQHVI